MKAMKMLLRASHINLIVFVLFGLARGAYLIDFSHVFHRNLANVKREAESVTKCPTTEPFRCPGDKKHCISIQYLCDGTADCHDGYDEDQRLCTAAKRPPVDEIKKFLESLMANHGPNYLEKLFGRLARERMVKLGGVEKVAQALSENETLEDFARVLGLGMDDQERLRRVFYAVENGDMRTLRTYGFKESELPDLKMFLDRLAATGFMD
ncbi:IDLSRF-like peptide [Brevipalpus obovatus]|uniref:IDLSRF-like peptide n=1 Tax=Brevipalpus obovatus TaxID=246614 RepID=UPI003D9F473A